MAKVELKQPIVAEISELLSDAKAAVLVDYRGLTVEQDTALRKQLRAEGEAEYMRILSTAYNDESKAEFYEFVRSLDAAKASLAGEGDNVLILDKDSPLVSIFYMMLGSN